MCANESLVNSQKRIAGKRRERRLDKYYISILYVAFTKMRNCGVGFFFFPSQLFLMGIEIDNAIYVRYEKQYTFSW